MTTALEGQRNSVAQERSTDVYPIPVLMHPVTLLPLDSLSNDEPIDAEALGVRLYPQSHIAFFEGAPLSTDSLVELLLALSTALTLIRSRSIKTRQWVTQVGVIELERPSFDLLINGEPIPAGTIDQYTRELRTLLEYTHPDI